MDHWTENYCEEEEIIFQKIMLLLYSHFSKKSVLFVNLGFNI